MNALASYLRHIIVTGLVMAVEKLGLPTEGLAEGADVVALAVVGTLSWLAVKYVAPYLKPSALPLIALCGILTIALPSCGASFSISGPLPEGLAEGADVIALAVVGTLCWLVVKYVAPYLKPSALPLIALCGILTIALPSCGASFSISGPLPDKLGGGTGTIIITPTK